MEKNSAIFNENLTKNAENDVKKRFLAAYTDNALEIERLTAELEKWRCRAVFDKDALVLVDMINTRIRRAVSVKNEIERSIAALQDAKLRAIMTLRYIDGMKWEDIEQELHLEYRWLLRLHRRALQEIGA